MSAATIPCDQCAQAVTAESAVYSSGGKLLCSSCLDAASMVEADALGAAARRKTKVALWVIVALLIIVPAAMVAAGQAEMLGVTLEALGSVIAGAGLLALRGMRRIRNADPLYRRGALLMLGSGIPTLMAGLVLQVLTRPAPPPPASLPPPVEWTSFRSPTGDFAALFPGSPTGHTTTETGAKGTITIKTYSVQYAGGEYSLMSSDLSGLTRSQAEDLFDGITEDTAARIHGRIVENKRDWIGKAPGRDILAYSPGAKTKVCIHVFATERGVYRLTVAFPAGVSHDQAADRFFKSIRLDPPAP
jgi:hypothetical protein